MREPVSPADSSKRARTEAIEAGLLLVVERVVEIYQCRLYRIQHLQHRLKPPLHLGESSCWRQDRVLHISDSQQMLFIARLKRRPLRRLMF